VLKLIDIAEKQAEGNYPRKLYYEGSSAEKDVKDFMVNTPFNKGLETQDWYNLLNEMNATHSDAERYQVRRPSINMSIGKRKSSIVQAKKRKSLSPNDIYATPASVRRGSSSFITDISKVLTWSSREKERDGLEIQVCLDRIQCNFSSS
jgi:hypothetical protein